MIQKVFSIFDSASRCYMPPFHCPTAGAAIRAFKDAANAKSHFVGQHPADYTLMEIATFCDSTGAYMPHAQFVNHGNGQTYVDSPLPEILPGDNVSEMEARRAN